MREREARQQVEAGKEAYAPTRALRREEGGRGARKRREKRG